MQPATPHLPFAHLGPYPETSVSGGEVAVHPPQSGEARFGAETGSVGMEQFPRLRVWREGTGGGEFSRVDGGDQDSEAGGVWGVVGRILTPLNRRERD